MHVRVRVFGKPDTIVVVESKLTKIDQFRRIVKDKFNVDIKQQRLFYGGKLLEDGYTFHDYNIKLNDVIQLMVKLLPDKLSDDSVKDCEEQKEDNGSKQNKENITYFDARSSLYEVGDLVDAKDKEQGAWFEAKIVRIVKNPDAVQNSSETKVHANEDSKENTESSKESDVENTPPEDKIDEESPKIKKKGIAKYFTKASSIKKKPLDQGPSDDKIVDENLLFKVTFDGEDEDSDLYCKLKDIRPRARHTIDIHDLKVDQKVMINHNTEQPLEKGYWYDFTVCEIKKLRTSYELIGTLYLGPEAIPQNDTVVRIHDKIFAIEEVTPLEQRNEEYKELMKTAPEKRSAPLNCMTCRDDENAPCKDCGCFKCLGKENPEQIVLCDECNNGYHMHCLNPPLKVLPEEDWYCPSCKRDPNDVVAPGAAKQTKKTTASKTSRDWGRGMACVGKTKTCAMPANHFGPIPGIEVGMRWRFRIQLSESGVHRPPVSGIHGRDVLGAFSIVLSGGYEDDVDHGYEFTYTGSGGRDLSGNKRTAGQSCDQTLTRENRALARNCAVKEVCASGADAGDNWRNGKPVRVVRSFKMIKHFPKYAPKEGIRYDGIYKVVKYYPEKGISGYRVWKYLLRRDDPSPAPWEPDAKQYEMIYPDGYLEAEEEKKALKLKKEKGVKKGKGGKKRALRESNQSTESEGEPSPPRKKRKTSNGEAEPQKKDKPKKNNSVSESPTVTIPSMFSPKTPKKPNTEQLTESVLTEAEKEVIHSDTLNTKLWQECLEVCESMGKKDFVEQVTQVFLCIICQEVAVSPVTTPCLHNFCMACLKLAFKSTGAQSCPACRQSLAKYEPELNEPLQAALRTILPGYDAGKK
ncbi:hypothetical protein O0L34_g2952 [Tuta absoluta]|nr:hypothetical protein O0L34_g2952 [Tuta absoluta]